MLKGILKCLVGWSEAQYLHDRLATALAHYRALILAEPDAPDSLAGLGELAHGRPGLHVEQLHVAVVATRNKEAVVELQAGDRVVVRAESVAGLGGFEGEDDDAAVGSARDKGISAQLQLTHERGMALEKSRALPRMTMRVNVDSTPNGPASYPVSGDQTRTVVSRLPVATRMPSKATA